MSFARWNWNGRAVGTKKGCWPDRHHVGDFGPAASLRALSDSEARRTNRQTGILENNILIELKYRAYYFQLLAGMKLGRSSARGVPFSS